MDANEIQYEDDQLIINDVARGVEEHEFVPFVQPCFELEPRRVMAAETLVRWTLPEDGTIVPAGAFVPSLERTHTITGLDWYIASEMCSFLKEATDTPTMLPVALNISSQHATDADFAEKLAAMADWRGIDHMLVSIELSQELIAKDERVSSVLIPAMIEEKFGVIADNFNADASALKPLLNMGIFTVKVSAKLWRDGTPEDLERLIARADELGMALVAEGVETAEELAELKSKGFRFAQGYYLAYPMSLDDYTKLCGE